MATCSMSTLLPPSWISKVLICCFPILQRARTARKQKRSKSLRRLERAKEPKFTPNPNLYQNVLKIKSLDDESAL